MNEWLGLAIGVVLTIGTGIFVAAEFSLVNLDRHELEQARDRGEHGLAPVISALKQTSTHLSSAQLGITITTLLTGYTLEPAISSLLGGALVAVGVPESWVRAVGAIIAVTLATFLSMIVGELIPKNWALALPKASAKIVVPLQNAFTWVCKPAVLLLNGSANALIRAVGIEPKEELSGARTAEELSALVRRSALVGVLESDKAVLLSRTLRFSEHTAADVMTPRPRLLSVDGSAPVSEVVRLAAASGHSRFPVTEDGDIDDVVGIVHVKAAVAVPPERREHVPVGAIKLEALMVPETVELDALLGELRGGGFQMAIVLDEYGGTAGIATLEDLVEEIVGELVDEHDASLPDRVSDVGGVSFDGLLRPDELHDRLRVTIPDDGPFETVGGFMMAEIGRIPVVGDRVEVAQGSLVVAAMDGRRIDRILFEQAPAPADDDAAAGGEAERPTFRTGLGRRSGRRGPAEGATRG